MGLVTHTIVATQLLYCLLVCTFNCYCLIPAHFRHCLLLYLVWDICRKAQVCDECFGSTSSRCSVSVALVYYVSFV